MSISTVMVHKVNYDLFSILNWSPEQEPHQTMQLSIIVWTLIFRQVLPFYKIYSQGILNLTDRVN